MTIQQLNRLHKRSAPKYRAAKIGVCPARRETLYQRIDSRVDQMLIDGLLEETRRLWMQGALTGTAAQAIGYKEYFPYFEGTQTQAECTEKLKQATRNYAKRQLTWFRNQNDAVWLYVDEDDVLAKATALVRDFLGK